MQRVTVMKELKETKTYANLLAAFAGESQATNKYTYYAAKARKEKNAKQEESKVTNRPKRVETIIEHEAEAPIRTRRQATASRSRTRTKSSTKTGAHTAKRMKTKADLKAEMEATLRDSKLGK